MWLLVAALFLACRGLLSGYVFIQQRKKGSCIFSSSSKGANPVLGLHPQDIIQTQFSPKGPHIPSHWRVVFQHMNFTGGAFQSVATPYTTQLPPHPGDLRMAADFPGPSRQLGQELGEARSQRRCSVLLSAPYPLWGTSIGPRGSSRPGACSPKVQAATAPPPRGGWLHLKRVPVLDEGAGLPSFSSSFIRTTVGRKRRRVTF